MGKKWLWLVLGLGVGVFLYTRYRSSRPKVVGSMPQGAKPTGVVQTTYNNRPPNYPQDAIGYGVRKWAEMVFPDGSKDWVEVVEK